jgi:hypothetical protein
MGGAVAGLLVLALATGACGAATAADADNAADVAAELVAAAEAAAGAPPVDAEPELPEGCEIVTETDDYGFPVEVMRCGEDVPPPDPGGPIPGVEGWVGSNAAFDLAVAIRDALVLQTGCGDGGGLDELALLAAGAPDEVRPALEKAVAELGQAALFCNLDAASWQDHTDLAVAYLEQVVAEVTRIVGPPGRGGAGDD